MTTINRRTLLGAGAALSLLPFGSTASAQDKIKLRFPVLFSEQDLRKGIVTAITEGTKDFAEVTVYYSGSLLKQGAELVGLQRGNVEIGCLGPQDIANQIPAWTILTAAYVVRDAKHLEAVFKSEAGTRLKEMAREQLGIEILGATSIGTRQLGLRPDRTITKPADMAGLKLRMPGGKSWQFLGEVLGANPTAVDFAEVYTALQSGAVDGQDNPLPLVRTQKFHETLSQIVLSGHLLTINLIAMNGKAWGKLSPHQQSKLQVAVDGAMAENSALHERQEQELVGFFKEQGLKVTEPDLEAFRSTAREKYLASRFAAVWEPGMYEAIAAL